MKKKIMLIDGNALCYRAFYAIRKLSTSTGEPTNAIFGFVTMLNKLLTEHKPNYLAVTFDLKEPTFRHKKFAEYKIHRKPMPDELAMQIPTIKEILKAYRIRIFEQKGYEADDIIGTLTNRLRQTELEILIITGDKDILQIVSNNIKIISPHKHNLVLDERWVRQRYGVSPGKIVDIIALAGDASDNIRGIPGIGEATAIDLVKRFGSLEQVLARADEIENRTKRENIKNFHRQAKLSRELAQLDLNIARFAQIDTDELLKQLKVVEEDKEKLLRIFKRLEFKSLMSNVIAEPEKIDYKVISKQQAKDFFQDLKRKKRLVIYLWATAEDPMLAKPQGISFCLEKEENFFLPIQDFILPELKSVLQDRDIKKLGHDLKYQKVVLSNYGIDLQGIEFDTMIAAYLIDPAKTKYTLSDIAIELLNLKLKEINYIDSSNKAAEICCRNANSIQKLSAVLEKELKQKELWNLFRDIEMPLIEVLADMEIEGIALDKDLLLHLSSDFEKKQRSLTKEIYEVCGEHFNINSPKQLSYILFEKLKLPRVKKTKTGSSTDTEVLTKLATAHPIASTLLQFREISKLRSTYIDGLAKLVHPKTKRIHTSFNQTKTTTGRLSCSRPNLQNIPIKTVLGKKIRQLFVPGKAHTLLLSADYSQIELRILAHLSEDRNLISAFKKDLDFHAYTASLIFDVSADKVDTEMRNTAKTVNFGIIYGMTPFGLSKDLHIGQAQAKEFIEAYFQRYPGVQRFITRQIKKAEKCGFVTTLLKRRRYIGQINSANDAEREFAQRVAINTPVQGSASDLIKAAMVQIYRELKAERLSTKMLLQVHDELVFALPESEVDRAGTLIKDRMENVIKLKVPLKVTMKMGKNWLEIK